MLETVVEEDRVRIGKRFAVRFQRTLRIPEDGKVYPLPPGLGRFPLHRVSDYADHVPAEWRERGGVFLPMYQREALWLAFEAAPWKPNAVKVGVGGVNAVSGVTWDEKLRAAPQDYLVCPDQPWLDGVNIGDGVVRQFVAMPLGTGCTVEGQLTGAERFGGLQLVVFEPRPGFFPERPPRRREVAEEAFALESVGAPGMGLAAGGSLRQKIYPDPHGVKTWDPNNRGRLFVHLVNSEQYRALTGREPPLTPVDAEDYARSGLPWFELFDEARPHVAGSARLAGVRGSGPPEAGLQPDTLPVARLAPRTGAARQASPSRKRKAMNTRSWIVETVRRLPLKAVEEELDGDLDRLLATVLSRPGDAPNEGRIADEVRRSAHEDCRRAVEVGRRALRKVNRRGEADLDADEVLGLEVVVLLVGRPALPLWDGKFSSPPAPWQALESNREAIENTGRSVGRIKVRGHPSWEWVGTGFLAAPEVVLTSRRVAVEFCRAAGRGQWMFEPGVKPFLDDLGTAGGRSTGYALTEVLGVHDCFDLALFRVRGAPPPPLPVAASGTSVRVGRPVYLVGHPTSDSRRADSDILRRLFAAVYEPKCLQPGEVRKIVAARSLLRHDCAPLSGNSGSCVVDLENHQVVGLHFGGKYREVGQAVALWTLTQDPLLKRAKVNFV